MKNSSFIPVCPSCNTLVSSIENFCPQCGVKLKGLPLSISLRKQIAIYIISFFLAPFGLYYAFKYLKQTNPEVRRVGIVVIILTVIAIALMIWVTIAFTSWEYQSIIAF